ncbi:hypothetical protein OBBRIDRAFT_603006 [Obba rivulosa]|uniref:Uncharacterized protein n=1 Tax=Obba rivulosa TaxID=1052685 RepID=A0A8E2B1B4_9APHY|nr:hypothetical protein OBBRIDRAFT_603006 [Obba rivulosa]
MSDDECLYLYTMSTSYILKLVWLVLGGVMTNSFFRYRCRRGSCRKTGQEGNVGGEQGRGNALCTGIANTISGTAGPPNMRE